MPHPLIKPFLDISHQDEFFIALCQNWQHSYVLLGTQNENGTQILASLGKNVLERDMPSPLAALLSMLFHGLPSSVDTEDEALYGERDRKKPKYHSPHYLAISISYQNYLEFIRLAETIIPSFPAYKPKEAASTGLPHRLYYRKSPLTKYVTLRSNCELNNDAKALSLWNSCRHTATAFIKSRKLSLPSMSNLFFVQPPFQAVLINGFQSAEKPFYILPEAPGKELSSKQEVLRTLFRRLEAIPKTKPNSQESYRRFCQLKALYLSLSEHEGLPLEALIEKMVSWRSKHHESLSNLRQRFFFDPLLKRTPKTLLTVEALITQHKNVKETASGSLAPL
jgi:hypothetical protein